MQARKIDWDEIINKLKILGKPDEEINEAIPKMKKIRKLCKEKNATLLAHYYQIPELQLIAHSTGDSLKLCLDAQEVTTPLIVFCGVHFMAESAFLLNPEKKVLLPDTKAGCSIAEGINPDMIKHIRKRFPKAAIISYVNTTAATKAEVDATYTSANAVKVFENIQTDEVILLPDPNLAANLVNKTSVNKKVYFYKKYDPITKTIFIHDVQTNTDILLPSYSGQQPKVNTGACYVHELLSEEYIEHLKEFNKADLIIGHFEVKPELVKKGFINPNNIGSTSDLLRFVKESNAKNILMLTECNFGAAIAERFPDRKIITPCVFCDYMKKISLDNVIISLEKEQHVITVPEPTASKARNAINKMFELSHQV
ncbi:quinolinate synthase [Candidatus Woesearchaeota archaeon CG10_big_fil_rev_8_21_14_0_10_30_7]|nr:MAG: quinolinate synthase [Candidatus Woesearchaeota archaeon CG10_big_fil_rev_8_21_14_0_10_30_7]